MKKQHVVQQIAETGVIPVIRAVSHEEAVQFVELISAGGVNIFEITMTVPDAVTLIEKLVREIGSTALIGAGTVLTPIQAEECIAAGAQFIVSPALNLETIAVCRRREITVMPGALTPTEVVTAWHGGADFVKVFPAGAMGGAGYIKSLKAPLPDIRIIPTGGVSLENAAAFIKAGASAVGIGSELADRQALKENRPEIITDRARRFADVIKSARE